MKIILLTIMISIRKECPNVRLLMRSFDKALGDCWWWARSAAALTFTSLSANFPTLYGWFTSSYRQHLQRRNFWSLQRWSAYLTDLIVIFTRTSSDDFIARHINRLKIKRLFRLWLQVWDTIERCGLFTFSGKCSCYWGTTKADGVRFRVNTCTSPDTRR